MSHNTTILRLQAAVIDRLPLTLARFQAELEDMGQPGLNLLASEGRIKNILAARHKDDSSDEEEGRTVYLNRLGTDPENLGPISLASSCTLGAIRQMLEEMQETLKKLEEAEDEKVATWVKRTSTGRRPKLDFKRLAIVEGLPMDDDDLQLLRDCKEASSWPIEKAEQYAMKLKGAREMPFLFLHDFFAALAEDRHHNSLIRNLWEAEKPEEVDAAISDPSISEGKHSAPLRFFGKLLKQWIQLTSEERAEIVAAHPIMGA